MGLALHRVRAGYANMFLSDLFAQTFANCSSCPVELFNTDGALGAARGAGFGVKFYPQVTDCFRGMEVVRQTDPEKNEIGRVKDIYEEWKKELRQF
jgi:xylulokinase